MDDLVNAHNYDDQIQAQRRAKAKEPLYDGKKKAPKRKHDEEEDEEESEDISSDEEEQN